MLYEAYPLIVTDLDFSVSEVCDETCFLEESRPYSLKIQLVDAAVTLMSIYYDEQAVENPPAMQYAAKRAMDEEKIDMMNDRISDYRMHWTAGDNDLVALYHHEKGVMFGEGYNLLGFEYYHSGVFEFLGHRNYPKADPDLVRRFDWRKRHNANVPGTPYWDQDTLSTGWLTSVKDQGKLCKSCWAFASIGTVEALTNLFTTFHFDLDLSEQHVLSCSYPGGGCDGGLVDSAFLFLRNNGVVTDSCCEYVYPSPNCNQLIICNNPDKVITIDGTLPPIIDQDSIRVHLIEYGPGAFHFLYPDTNVDYHDVVLSGFEFDPADSTIIWNFKNSWGLSVGENGFESMKVSNPRGYFIQTPIYLNEELMPDTCRDEDHDGYYFWGIGPKPQILICSETKDCNDNDPFVGGYDENYNCSCIFEFDSTYHHISSDTTWNDTTYINYTLVIDSSATLTISSYAGFSPEAGIIVKQGGELVIDGGLLTKVCPDLWRGIQVWGSDTVQYLNEYFGVVRLMNDAVIEYAYCGISNHCTLCDRNLMQSGGIIMAEDAVFRNNRTDITFAPFKNQYLGNELSYSATFENCLFLTTDAFYPDFRP